MSLCFPFTSTCLTVIIIAVALCFFFAHSSSVACLPPNSSTLPTQSMSPQHVRLRLPINVPHSYLKCHLQQRRIFHLMLRIPRKLVNAFRSATTTPSQCSTVLRTFSTHPISKITNLHLYSLHKSLIRFEILDLNLLPMWLNSKMMPLCW